jgi:ABC-type uncharacterized transport system permease subunit
MKKIIVTFLVTALAFFTLVFSLSSLANNNGETFQVEMLGISSYFYLALPYVVCLIVLVFTSGRDDFNININR